MKMKKFFKRLLLTSLFAVTIHGTTFASPIPQRGIIEGFYGKPWTAEERLDMINFCRSHSFNSYIYAPKDDPYHREKWREEYPAKKFNELKNLVAAAKKNNINFIFAVSPGLDLNFRGKKGDADFEAMIKKLDSMYQIGVRQFAIFFDDIKDKDGEHQAEFLNKVYSELHKRHKDISPLITVPTEYFYEDMVNKNKLKDYSEDFSRYLDKKILVLYTGSGVICEGISNEDLNTADKIYGRELGVWWNYPVNDFPMHEGDQRNAKLALGPIDKLPTENLPAIFFNPMGQEILSKISLATAADYSNSPENYDAEKSWNKAIENQFGDLAPAMKIFASHSQRMENNWAHCGAEDGQKFNTLAYLVLADYRAGRTDNFSKLETQIDEMENAADTLLKNLPAKILAECKPQLEQFKRIAQADRLALESLKNKKLDAKLESMRKEIAEKSKSAVLSEKAGIKFIDDVINLFPTKKKK